MTDQSMGFSQDARKKLVPNARQLAQKPLRGRGTALTTTSGHERKGAGVPRKGLALQFDEAARLEKVVREQLGRVF